MSLWNTFKEQRHSLTSTTLTAVFFRVSLVVGITALVTYWHLSKEIEKNSLQTLEKYVRERSLREREIFKLASDNHYVLRKDLVDVFRKIEKSNDDPVAEFNAIVKKDPDGALRSPRSKPGVKKEIDVWVAKNSRNDALFRRKVVAFSKVLLRFAPAFHVRFTDTYIALSENANIVYWPEFPDWSAGTPANFDYSSYELYQIGKKQFNPERKTRWSGVYFDDAIGKWMVSASTPFDDSRGFLAGVIGHDVMIDDLIKRTTNDGLKGTYNILISGEGRLMAHPKKMDTILAAKGRLTVDNLQDPELLAIYREIKASAHGESFSERIIDQSGYDQFIAVSYLPETDWYFVTIYPKSLIRDTANSAAIFIIIVGLISLLVDLVLLYFIFRHKVFDPLEQFIKATQELERGQTTTGLPIERKDEIGKLSRSFDSMAKRIREARKLLNEKIDQRTRDHAKATAKAEHATNILHNVGNTLNSVNLSLVELDASLRKSEAKEGLVILQGLQRKIFTIEEIVQEQQRQVKDDTFVEDVDIEQIVQESILMLSLGDGDGITLKTDFKGPSIAQGQRLKVMQLVVNLLKNAAESCKAAPSEKTKQIDIKISSGDGYITLEVKDSGVGIAPENLKKIFKHGFTTKEEGYGFGLHFCLNAAHEMNGTLNVESQGVGYGATFILRIPSV